MCRLHPLFPLIPEFPYLPPEERKALLARHRRAVEEEWFVLSTASYLLIPVAAIVATALSAYLWRAGGVAFAITFMSLWVARAIVVTAMMRRRVIAELRSRRLRVGCGYDLCATPDRCPECGTHATLRAIA